MLADKAPVVDFEASHEKFSAPGQSAAIRRTLRSHDGADVKPSTEIRGTLQPLLIVYLTSADV